MQHWPPLQVSSGLAHCADDVQLVAHTLLKQPKLFGQPPQLRVPPQPLGILPHLPAQLRGVQPHVPALPPPPQVCGDAQATQTEPAVPHCELVFPATQLPALAAEQQPLLQALVELHDEVHWLPAPQALSGGQSLLLLHPHVKLTHWCPLLFEPQALQTPELPHAPAAVPG